MFSMEKSLINMEIFIEITTVPQRLKSGISVKTANRHGIRC